MAKSKSNPAPKIRDRITELRRVKASDLLDNPKNWRTHPKSQLAALDAVLHEIGFAGAELAIETPEGLMLIDGHARKKLAGNEIIPVLVTDLSIDEANLILATFDPIGAMAEADAESLKSLLESVNTADQNLADMLTKLAEDNGIAVPAAEIVEDEVPEPPVDPITKPGDLWILGEYRLLCGDSTKAEDVARLMGGAKADLIHTDPPYGVSFQSNMRTVTPKFDVIANDDKVLTDWIPPAIEHSKGWVFVWTTWKVLSQWLDAVRPFGQISNMVVWHKGGGGIGDLKKTFSTDYELALVFHRGAELCGKRIGSVWSFNKDAAAAYVHPTQKPVALAAEAIEKTTRRGALVMDLFLGSGTTLIAAEQLGRSCFGMELAPQFCDVIVARWENLTGLKATLAPAA